MEVVSPAQGKFGEKKVWACKPWPPQRETQTSANVFEFKGIWDWTLHKNGVISFSVDHSTGGKTSGDILPSIQAKPFGFYLPRFYLDHLDFSSGYFSF